MNRKYFYKKQREVLRPSYENSYTKKNEGSSAMYTFISVLIGLLACGLFFNNNPIGILALIIGGLVFIRGNRKSKQKREEQRHREMMEALQKQK